jgi:hypothetical protein
MFKLQPKQCFFYGENKMSESEWHDRPIEEKSYLDDKIEKLSVFLDITVFATSAADEDEKALLVA